MDEEQIKKVVRESYAKVAKSSGQSCCEQSAPCCDSTTAEKVSAIIGYSKEDLEAMPEGSIMGLGCGNPVGLASVQEGETVLDLGSGPGLDCFLAARKVGKNGKVIGVDMTPEMIEKARENAKKGDFGNIEFRLGEIENIPAADNSVDLIISNCVINLAPDKKKVFKEAFRVLKPGGRMIVSDIVLGKELPDFVRESERAYAGCVAGALLKDEYLEAIRGAGFENVELLSEAGCAAEIFTSDAQAAEFVRELQATPEQVEDAATSILSATVRAVKPN